MRTAMARNEARFRKRRVSIGDLLSSWAAPPNGLEVRRQAGSQLASRIPQPWAGQIGSSKLLGSRTQRNGQQRLLLTRAILQVRPNA